ncbi:MAG: xylulokinase [Akkermansiaceae bacterium]|nr:xylulokinase [Akkermansiaceae bacterium]
MQFIGIELSPAGTRAVALDLESASIQAEAWVPHAWIEGLPTGYREQDPARWIEAVDQAIRQCVATLGEARAQVAAIGVTGPLRGLVLLDEANRIVRPTKLAGDVSVKRQADEIARAFGGAPGLIELAGQCPGVDSAAAECLWLKQHEPYYFQRAASLLTVQDFIAYWLTGSQACTPGSASATGLFDIRRRAWSSALLDFIEPNLAGLLPPVSAPDQARGTLRGALAAAWGLAEQVLVAAGGAAPMMSAFAAGCVEDGAVAVDLGAVATLTGCGAAPVIDLRAELAAYCNATGGWLGMATTASTAVAPEVIRRHYGWSVNELETMATQVAPGADGLLLLPYFTGEQVPRLPEGTGVLHGITPENFTPAHMARATVEGVALGVGYALSRLHDLGLEPPEIRLSGPGADSLLMRRLLADVTGVPVAALARRLDAAAGAAMHAAVAFFHQNGESLGFDEIAKYLVVTEDAQPTEPDMQVHSLYQSLISRQQYLVDTLYPAGFL